MSTTPHNAPLDGLRRRRAELRQSMGALEFAIAAPVRDDPARWADEVAHAMRALESDFRDHLDVTEGTTEHAADTLELNDIGRVEVRLASAIAPDPYEASRTTGSSSSE